ncbi:hypothetical protein MA16_Dca020796 [Dendrobium catenatum]|uniref:Uncharacterized protein n=1 Tax=Dendrobium catenatum TaxID=906689 RepID=A0A2I0XFT0_9ASPA|nr:hypothetical protein MA16_Dca020796 [Dendrobium catenatum]
MKASPHRRARSDGQSPTELPGVELLLLAMKSQSLLTCRRRREICSQVPATHLPVKLPEPMTVNSDVVVILVTLLCTLICVIGPALVTRCA